MTQAVILAGGYGTRLANTVKDKQKVMASVGGRPFCEYILSQLKSHGITKVVFAVSYKYEQIKDFFGDCYDGIQIVYSVEETPLGTGGAIKQAANYTDGDEFAVINGDTFFDVDLNKMYAFFKERKADIVLSAKKMPDCARYSTLDIADDGKINRFKEKSPCQNGYINGGIYIINKKVFSDIKKTSFSFEKEILEKKTSGLYAYKSDGFFIDMGIPDDYFKANISVPLRFGHNRFKAAFLDRDGVICKEKHHLYKTEDFEFTDGCPEALEKLREKGYLLIVITNQAGVAKGLYTEEDVDKLHTHMLNLLKDITHIEKIYYCPYHKDAVVEKYGIDSPDRKPNDGMIQRAVKDFAKNGIYIDLKKSILAGDKLSDIMCGKKAGIGKNILLRSGHAIDENSPMPDAVFDTLAQAVDKLEEI